MLFLLVTACSTKMPARTERHVCQAFCSYANVGGAGRRILVTSLQADRQRAWQNLVYQCQEIQGISGVKRSDELQIPNPKFDGNNYPEFFPASAQNACALLHPDS